MIRLNAARSAPAQTSRLIVGVSAVEIKDILLFLSAGEPNAARISVASRLAGEHGAFVLGHCFTPEPKLSAEDCYATGAEAIRDVLAERDQGIRDMAGPTEVAFRRAMADISVGAAWSISSWDQPVQVSALLAQSADLVILSRPQTHDDEGRNLAERFMLASGSPCLIVPETEVVDDRFDKIVLAWNGRREAKRAMDDGLVFLKGASAVQVLMIGSETASTIDRDAADALLRHLARHGVGAELRRLPHRASADIGDALLDGCETFGADLLVMGAYGHPRAMEGVFGGVTRTVLLRASTPVLMSH